MVPATYDASGWRVLRPVPNAPSLPGDWADGFYSAPDGVHILTRHLSLFALLRDLEPPAAPTDFAGEVGPAGLTLHWRPGVDNSGLLGQLTLFADGVAARTFAASETTAQLGPLGADDTRRFTLRESDQAGNVSTETPALRAVPALVGKSLAEAEALLAERGFKLGIVVDSAPGSGAPGTVTGPAGVRVATEGSAVDVEAVPTVAGTKLAFGVVAPPKLRPAKQKTVSVKINLTRAATVTAALYANGGSRKLYTWRFVARAGRSTVALRWPQAARRAGTYTIRFTAVAGGETVRRTARVRVAVAGARR
jgi:hypothetical protein